MRRNNILSQHEVVVSCERCTICGVIQNIRTTFLWGKVFCFCFLLFQEKPVP